MRLFSFRRASYKKGGVSTGRNLQPRRKRYDIALPLRFSVKSGGQTVQGTGRTRNISTSGVLFETDQPLRIGELVRLSIEWPALLEGVHQMMLIVQGRVVRRESRGWALRMTNTEFGIRGRRR
jgi:hypothetical protein